MQHTQKQKAIRQKALPMAIYGCDTTPVCKTDLQKLQSASKKALSVGNAATGSPALLACTWGQASHDPL
eukprot:6756383-Alexandrium_andersonii.AAC.1